MNSQEYCKIMDNEMLPTLLRFYGMDPSHLQDYNDDCRISEGTMQWYADSSVSVDWPAHSPKLNPTEHLWNELDVSELSGDAAKFFCSTEWDVTSASATHSIGCLPETCGERAWQGGCCFSNKRWFHEVLKGQQQPDNDSRQVPNYFLVGNLVMHHILRRRWKYGLPVG